jgi:hypothetical protein
MPTNFPAPKRTTGAALLIARETVGAVILTVAIVARAGMRIGAKRASL